MPAFETYAKRKLQAAKSGQPDVYQYAAIPSFLRRQIWFVLEGALGPYVDSSYVDAKGNFYWIGLCNILEREIEGFPGPSRNLDPLERCQKFIESEPDIDNWLSLVELACRALNGRIKNSRDASSIGARQEAKDAIEEINTRFREHALGYQFEGSDIIRIDSEFVHHEVVLPALALLRGPDFETANEDFMTAHRHYRAGETKDAIVAANRAFESTLKAICKIRGWPYPEGARAKELIAAVRKHALFPTYLDEGLNTYIALLKTGLPGVRNEAGGHGAAPDEGNVPEYLAAYAIHMTATNILLLGDALRTQK